MAVARAVYTDLVVINFTPGAATSPNTTQLPLLMTALYKDGYRIVGDTYAANDAGDEPPIIDTESFKDIIVKEGEEIAQAWHMSSPQVPPPSSAISPAGIFKIRGMLKRRPERMDNVRVYGEEWDDY